LISIRNEGVKLRPFDGADKAEIALSDTCSLRIETGSIQETLRHRHKVAIPSEEMSTSGRTLIFEKQRELKNMLINMAELEDIDVMVVVLEGPASPERKSDVLFRCSINDLPSMFELGKKGEIPSSRSLMGSKWGVEIEVACVLNKTIDKAPLLQPKDRGALLAKVSFLLKPSGLVDGFKPMMLTDEKRHEFGLENKSWIYVRITDGMITPDSEMESSLELYVDEEMMGNRNVAGPEIKGLFDNLIVSSLFHTLFSQVSSMLESAEDQGGIENSPIERILQKAFTGEKLTEARTLLIEDPSKLASMFLANQSVEKNLSRLMKEAASE